MVVPFALIRLRSAALVAVDLEVAVAVRHIVLPGLLTSLTRFSGGGGGYGK